MTRHCGRSSSAVKGRFPLRIRKGESCGQASWASQAEAFIGWLTVAHRVSVLYLTARIARLLL